MDSQMRGSAETGSIVFCSNKKKIQESTKNVTREFEVVAGDVLGCSMEFNASNPPSATTSATVHFYWNGVVVTSAEVRVDLAVRVSSVRTV